MKKIYKWAVGLPIISKLIKKPFFAKLLSYEVLIYLFFGVLTTIVNLFSFLIFDRLLGEGVLFSISLFGKSLPIGTHLVANVFAWFIAVAFAFVTNKLFVFESKGWARKQVAKELSSFVGARLFSLGIEEFGLILLVDIVGQKPIIAKALLAVIVVILNYFFSKFFIFRNKSKGV